MPTGVYLRTKKHNENLRKSHLGNKLSDKSKKKLSKSLKKVIHTTEWNEKVGNALRGKKNHNWKGGRTSLVKQIRKSYKYRQWRSDIFERDNYTCVICGDKNFVGRGKTVTIEADHYPKMFSEILEEYQIKIIEEALECEALWNINNGRTLCQKCHNLTKNGRPKKTH